VGLFGQPAPLKALIRSRIAEQGGAVPFADFMQWALYEPEHGYYERFSEKIGRRGDFYTSVSVGPLFGQLLAFRFSDWIEELQLDVAEPIQLVEAGAHDGTLAKDVLEWLDEHRPDIFARLHYVIVEPSAQRQVWQRKTLVDFLDKVTWSNDLPSIIKGIIFSNELLDAFPVHRLCWGVDEHRWRELGVRCTEWGFEWCFLGNDSSDRWEPPNLPEPLLDILPDRFVIETAPTRVEWWKKAANALVQGWLMTFDYGLETPEFFQPHRFHGTLRGYRQHRSSDDLLGSPGETDITSHVDFTQIALAGESCGLDTVVQTWQSRWLVDVFGRLLNNPAKFGVLNPARVRQFQTLTHPEHMGRSFRVLVQRRR
jgi:SAM-dependent MidA family methyltransferase